MRQEKRKNMKITVDVNVKNIIVIKKDAHEYRYAVENLLPDYADYLNTQPFYADLQLSEQAFKTALRRTFGRFCWLKNLEATMIIRIPLSMADLGSLSHGLECAGVRKIVTKGVDDLGKTNPYLQ